MAFDNLLLEREGAVAVVTFNRPKVLNALNAPTLDELRRAVLELKADEGVRVVRLETNKSLVEAITLYRSAGYREVDAFNDEPYSHHWFEKRLA